VSYDLANEPQGEVRLIMIMVGPPWDFTCASAMRQVEIPVTPK